MGVVGRSIKKISVLLHTNETSNKHPVTDPGWPDAGTGTGGGRPGIRAHGEGGEDAGRRRLHTVYGDVGRVRLPRTYVQE